MGFNSLLASNLNGLRHSIVVIGTLPYYRFFEFNTLGVIKRIAVLCSRPDDFPILLRVLSRWRHRKLAELQYISIACAILLAAVIGTCQWNNTAGAYWLCRAFWYISMVLSVLGILLAAQQVAVLNFLGDLPKDPELVFAHDVVARYLPLLISGSRSVTGRVEAQKDTKWSNAFTPKKKMIFIWQCPMMFMSYSVCFFLLGLTVLVVTPLIRIREHGWTPDCTVACIYLGTTAVAGTAFVFCAFWVYHYLDLEVDSTNHYVGGNMQSVSRKTLPDQNFRSPDGPMGEGANPRIEKEIDLQDQSDNVDYAVENHAALMSRTDSFH